MTRPSFMIATLAGSSLLLAGCVAADPHYPESLDMGGSVSYEEYTTAFEALRDCVTEAGVIVTEPILSPVDNVRLLFAYEFNGLSQDVAAAATDACEKGTWTEISIAYTLNTPPRMDADLAVFVSDCLGARGLTTSGDEGSVTAFVGSVGQPLSDDVTDCVIEGAAKLYPDLRLVTIGS